MTSSSSTGRRAWPARGHTHLFRRRHRHPSARLRQTRLAGEPGLLLAALVCSGARDHLVWKICDHEDQIRCTESIGFSWLRASARGPPCVGVGRGRPRQELQRRHPARYGDHEAQIRWSRKEPPVWPPLTAPRTEEKPRTIVGRGAVQLGEEKKGANRYGDSWCIMGLGGRVNLSKKVR
jgi:hypothetical protein